MDVMKQLSLIGIVPVIGLTLPLISYGGSSIISGALLKK